MAGLTNGGASERGKSQRIFVGLGSNMGDRLARLREAIEHVERLGLRVTGASSIYETEPVGFKDQPWFLNQVIELREAGCRDAQDSDSSRLRARARELLDSLLDIERRMGRERTLRYGARVIDLDLLFYGDAIIRQAAIEVPHPRLHLRRFVLEPMRDLAPDFVHPALKKSCRELLAALSDSMAVREYKQGS
jgi:2-amino-4-hydroxy-6-hydroxymethyldihydropteridine diphosphokinase